MPKRAEKESAGCCEGGAASVRMSCCRVEAIVPIDARGQVVLPKDVREKAGIRAGDKLAVISWQSGGEVCCLSLMKADEFATSIKSLLGPMMSEILA